VEKIVSAPAGCPKSLQNHWFLTVFGFLEETALAGSKPVVAVSTQRGHRPGSHRSESGEAEMIVTRGGALELAGSSPVVAAHSTARSQARVAQEQSRGEGREGRWHGRKARGGGGQDRAVRGTSTRTDRGKAGEGTWGGRAEAVPRDARLSEARVRSVAETAVAHENRLGSRA